ncbi:hypothetical protein Btru_009761 [Bulinus truncatus]|nr:hypothetical protein Btru_009761 [Bulinus truncatus]
MPITGNLNQETAGLDDPQSNFVSGDNTEVSDHIQAEDCTGSEVSSTTVDPDPSAESAQMHSEDGGVVSESVQCTTSVDMSSDSLDGFKDSVPVIKESAIKVNPQYSKGFQDAFAAFASSSFREEEESIPMDNNDERNSKSEAVVSAAADSAGSVALEPFVSSAIDSGLVTTTEDESYVKQGEDSEIAFVAPDITTIGQPEEEQVSAFPESETDPHSFVSTEQTQVTETVSESQTETATASDSVYFIQTTDASGQVVTSIIDPNDIPAYADSIVYKQCMLPDGDIETTIVSQGGVPVTQEEQPQEQVTASQEVTEQVEPQIIYVHDANGQLTPIDSLQSANDVAPPGKQFVYMQDSTGRIIRTIMDANQTMVPGQQVYYTQSEDGRIITSVMDSATAGVTEDGSQQTADQLYLQQTEQVYQTQEEAQSNGAAAMVGGTAGFNIDNSMSGLSMLAELSHLTAGQASESRTTSSTESNSMDMDEFRPVAMVTRRVGEDGDAISADITGLKVGEADSSSLDQDQGSSLSQEDSSGQEDSVISKLLAEMKTDLTPSHTVSRDNLFVQWQNLDAMCWMDVVLIMLVYSPTLRPLVNLDPAHELATTLLITLLKANRQAQVLLQNLLKKSNGAEISGLQTGAGNTASLQDPKTSKLVCKENMDEIGKAINILYAMREKIWQALQPRLRCERGKHNSPVLVLPLLVREKPAIKQMFTMNYRYVFKCEVCGYSQDDTHTKILPSIPAVPADFNMCTPSFVRNCFECQAPNQRMLMKFEGLQDFVQMHFVKGLPHNRFEELSFDFNEDHYEVTAVVHYKNNPDHFIAWVRNAPGNTWMECDDLKSVITRYQHMSPNIPPSQVHMVMWERRLTPQHTLVMRDTEDTKLLASLVLTVQQPNTHQSTDPAARPTGAPSTQSPMHTSQTNSLLGTNVQTFSTYNPRGRGRGRGSRGVSYGSRGRGSASTTLMPVRRAAPTTASQLTSSTSTTTLRARTTPQTIRVPLSSIPGAIRATTLGGDKIVLLSSNSQGSASTSTGTGTTSKVVVVRSQGGASNITAAQILQLLQRTGAISGGRVTTTINTSSNAAPVSQSYIIQPDGSVVSTSNATAETETSMQQSSGGMVDTGLAAMEEPAEETSVETPMETNTDKSEPTEEEISQAPIHAEHQISTLPFTASTPVRDQSSGTDTIVVSPEGVSSSATTEEIEQVSDVNSVLGQAQQPTRYIQIPNPSGSGTILTQLCMRGGKMVLIPVDKNTQAQLTGGSVLKLPNTPTNSPKIAIRAVNPQILSASSAGALLSQLQQQQQQLALSQISSSNTSTVSTVGGQKRIALPLSGGQKKTIQVITVPASQSGQGITKKIVSPVGGQKSTAPAVTSTDGRILSQSGNIVIREIKTGDGDSPTALSASLASPSQLISTPAVSLLKDVSSRSGTSLLSSAASQLKNQESFRYILQGSSTTHILHTGTSTTQVTSGTTGRAFTALSSSGTIIGGQLTPSPTTSAIGTSPLDQDASLQENEDDTPALTPTRRLSREIDTTEYIPLGRGRAKTRGGRGRGRGGRTPRGRGRSQLWSTDTDYIPPSHPSRKISTLSADLRQIGAHIIESSAEAVDGVPVVSIPDYTAEEPNHHTEAESVAETLGHVHADSVPESTLSAISELTGQVPIGEEPQENQLMDTSLGPEGPRVITQAIPSIKANHGFDILTQGILGSAANRSSLAQPKQARSLLTGSPVTIPATMNIAMSSATTILDASEMISAVSKMAHNVSQAQTVNTSEIDALIEAAQAAARPGDVTSSSFAAPPPVVNSKSPISTLPVNAEALGAAVKPITDVPPTNVSDSNSELEIEEDVEQACEMKEENETKETKEEEAVEKEARVVSFDESQVSAAERYRMPMELFQPDEESPEKPVKALAPEFPVKFFQDSEVTSQEEMSISPQVSPKGAARHRTISEVELDKKSSLDSTVSSSRIAQRNTNITKLDFDSSFGDDVDIESTEKVVSKPKKAQDSKHSLKTVAGEQKRGRKKKTKSKKVNNNNESSIEGKLSPQFQTEESITRPKGESKHGRANLKYKSTNIGGFATDLLMESEQDEQVMMEPAVKEVEVIHADRAECEHSNTSEACEEEVPDQENPIQDSHVEEVIEKQDSVEEKLESPKKRDHHLPAHVCYKKLKIDWAVDENGLEKMIHQPRSFNYRVLQGKLQIPHHRHPSLSRLQDIYTSPPSPIYHVFKEKPVVHRPPIVIRRIAKALQRPAVDPSKEPTVIPLVAEDEGDPSYTGGSVVTSPVDGEIFNGVIIKKKTEVADWSSSLDGEEDDLFSEAGRDLKADQVKYCEHLLTEYYIEAVSSGDYTYLDDLIECSHEQDTFNDSLDSAHEQHTLNDSFELEEKITSKHVNQCEFDPMAQHYSEHGVHEDSEQVIERDFDQIIQQESQVSVLDSPSIQRVSQEVGVTVPSSPDVSLTGSTVASPSISSDQTPLKKKRGRPKKNSTPETVTPKAKAAAPKSEVQTNMPEAATFNPERVNLKSEAEKSEISVHSRLNGVESTSSPQAVSKPDALQAQKDITAAYASFPSPSRRSGRTPIPSKRVLDALEDSPAARSALKGRRTSLVSSDDEHSGYSTGESVAKKMKKHVLTS